MKLNFFLTFLSISLRLVAQEQTFVREYTYKASEIDSKVTSRIVATNQLRSILLNEIGVYVESESILETTDVDGKFAQNFTENISTISAGITKLKILEEKWNGEEFWMKASITVDLSELEKSLKQLSNDRQKIKELEYVKGQLDQVTKNIEQLKKDLADAKSENQRVAISEQYLSEVDEMQNAFSSLFDGIFLSISDGIDDMIKQDPNNGFLYWQRGGAKSIRKDFQAAIIDYDKAIKLGYTEAYEFRAEAKYELKDYIGALADYDSALEKDKQRHNELVYHCYQGRGLTKIELQDYNGAMNDFNQALDLCDDNLGKAKIYWEIGNLKYQLKDYEGAVRNYKKSKELNPLNAQFYKTRANAKELNRDYEGAILDYDRAIELDPNDPQSYHERAVSKFYIGDYSGAIFDLDKTIDLNPKYESVYLDRGRAISRLLSNRATLYHELFYKGENTEIKDSYGMFISAFSSNQAALSELYSKLSKTEFISFKDDSSLDYQDFVKEYNFDTVTEYYYDNDELNQVYNFFMSRIKRPLSFDDFKASMSSPSIVQNIFSFLVNAACADFQTAGEMGEKDADETKEWFCK